MVLPRGLPLGRSDLDMTPHDGHRYELIDGSLIVTPTPPVVHQMVLGGLVVQLDPACPPELTMLFAPFNVTLADDTVLQPDLLVARSEDFTHLELPGPPLLAVEVLSPTTRRFDLEFKRSRYEEAGTASYWVVDPDELTLTAWDLADGAYVEVAHVTGDDEWTASLPFPVTIAPAALRD